MKRIFFFIMIFVLALGYCENNAKFSEEKFAGVIALFMCVLLISLFAFLDTRENAEVEE